MAENGRIRRELWRARRDELNTKAEESLDLHGQDSPQAQEDYDALVEHVESRSVADRIGGAVDAVRRALS
jgi:hypothetical protein